MAISFRAIVKPRANPDGPAGLCAWELPMSRHLVPWDRALFMSSIIGFLGRPPGGYYNVDKRIVRWSFARVPESKNCD